jgi:hypothetical protein
VLIAAIKCSILENNSDFDVFIGVVYLYIAILR